MTRFVYVLKEIRACLEAEILTDLQQRLVVAVAGYGQSQWSPRHSSADFPAQLT